MRAGVKADGLHLRGIGLAVRERGLLDRAVDDLSDDIAVPLVHRDETAFQHKRQFVDNGRIDGRALDERKAASGNLVVHLVPADETQVIAPRDGIGRPERDRERLSGGDVRPRPVRGVDADRDLVLKRDPAPGGVHHVGRPVLAVGGDHQDGHGEHPVLAAEVLFHVFSFNVYPAK